MRWVTMGGVSRRMPGREKRQRRQRKGRHVIAAALGWVGTVGTFGAYVLLSRGRWHPTSIRYAALNGVAGLLGAMGSSLYGAWPSVVSNLLRSEERRVGKECRSRWSPYH